jgi:tRNA nucleotidyltransferase/poly(A) polymerase
MKQFIKNKLRMNILLENRIKADMFVPDDIKAIATVFKGNGYKLFIVGGAVRDFLLNQKIKDYDLATDAIPDKVEAMMKAAGFRTLPTGKAFGVINVFTDTGEYEIATFRVDRYVSGDEESFKKYLKGLNNGKYEEFMAYLAKQ